MAALQGKTIKQYTIERLFSNEVDTDQAWQQLKTLLEQRIHDGLSGKISTKNISEILDEEMSAALFATHASSGVMCNCANI